MAIFRFSPSLRETETTNEKGEKYLHVPANIIDDSALNSDGGGPGGKPSY